MIKNTLVTLSLISLAACGMQQPNDKDGVPSDDVIETDAAYDDEVLGDATADAGIEADADVLEEEEPEVEVVETEITEPAPEPRTEVEPPVVAPTTPVVPTMPAPHVAPMRFEGGKLLLATEYLKNAKCAELRGELPGSSWTSGPRGTDTNADGYYEFPLSTSGTYRFTYVSVDCTTGAQLDWALYGIKDVLVDLTTDALAPIICDAANCQSPGSCSLKATFSPTAAASAGNMATATGC